LLRSDCRFPSTLRPAHALFASSPKRSLAVHIGFADQVQENAYEPLIVLTDFRVFGKSVVAGNNTVLKKSMPETIEVVPAGKKALSPEATFELVEHTTDDALTAGEIEVLRMISAGNANPQIADLLSVTEETAKGRVKNSLSKLNANDRTHASTSGLKREIIDL
jgi:DNA-binding CsgD family transcriptional regulator